MQPRECCISDKLEWSAIILGIFEFESHGVAVAVESSLKRTGRTCACHGVHIDVSTQLVVHAAVSAVLVVDPVNKGCPVSIALDEVRFALCS